MNQSNEQLIKECLRGNSQAQHQLYELYKVSMFRVCLRYARDRHSAEDMLQEGFIKVFRDLQSYSGKGAFGGWVRKVIVNAALMHIRRNAKLFIVEDLSSIQENQSNGENVYAKLGAEALTKLIQKLPDGYRAVFNMYVVEGYSHKEIAKQLDISPGTSKSQLFKAKAQLQKMIQTQMVVRQNPY